MVTLDLLDLVDLLCGGGRFINPGFALHLPAPIDKDSLHPKLLLSSK